MCESRRHAVVFEAARGVHTLVLQKETSGLNADEVGHGITGLQQSLPLTDGHHLFGRSKGQ